MAEPNLPGGAATYDPAARFVRVTDADGKRVSVSTDADLAEGLSSGRYKFDDGATISIVNPEGRKGVIPAAEYLNAHKLGYRLQSGAEQGQEYERRKYDDPYSAFGQGVLNAATLGHYQMAHADPTSVKKVAEFSPTASAVGEVVGSFAPIAPGAGAAVSAVGAGTRAGGAVASLLAKTGDTTARRAVKAGAALAVEGGVQETLGALDEALLSKDPMNAEAVLAIVGPRALLGAGVGGGLGVGGSLLSDGLKFARTKAAQTVAATVDEAPAVAPGAGLETLQDLYARRPAKPDGDIRAAMRAELKDAKALLGAEDAGRAAAQAKYDADLAAWKGEVAEAAPKARGDLADFDRTMRRARARARKVLEDGRVEEYKIGPGGERIKRAVDPNATAAGKRLDRTQEIDEADIVAVQGDPRAIKAAADRYDEARATWEARFKPDRQTVGGKPSRPEHAYSIKLSDAELRDVLADPEAIAAHQAMGKAYTDLVGALNPSKKFEDRWGGVLRAAEAPAAPPPAVDRTTLVGLRMRAQELDEALAVAPIDAQVKAARTWIADVEKALPPVTPDDVAAHVRASGMPIESLKPGSPAEVLARAKVYQRRINEAIKAQQTPDQPGFLGALAGGAVGDAVFDGVLGVAFGGLLGHGVGRAVKWAVRKPFAAKVMGARGDVMKQISDGIDSFVGSFKARPKAKLPPATSSLMGAPLKAGEKAAKNATEAAKQRAVEVRELAANEQATSEMLWKNLEGVRALDVNLYDQVSTLVRRGIAFLADKAPMPPDPKPLRRNQAWLLSPIEVERFARYMAAEQDPVGRLLGELAAGRLSMETVETVRTLRPQLFEQIRAQVADRVSQMKTELPLSKRTQLGLLFDAPTDESLEPMRAAALQQMFADAAVEQAEANDISKNAVGSVKLKREPNPTPAQTLAG